MWKAIVLSVVFIFISLHVFSQQSNDYQRLTLNEKSTSIEKILQKIENQTGVSFSYSSKVIQAQRKIDFVVKDKPLNQVLKKLKRLTSLDFKVMKHQIIIKKRKESQTPITKTYTISGYVLEEESMESLPGVTIYVKGTALGTSTNKYGFYSITLPSENTVNLIISSVGYEIERIAVGLEENVALNVNLKPKTLGLEEIVVHADAQEKISETEQMSAIKIPVAQIKDIPTFILGIKDPLKAMQLMPGVQTSSEINAGMYVRGGSPDQNLLMLDDAVVYNAFHVFGLFSSFNSDAIKSIELIKGGFPARYGGRLSSVVEMQMKDGNKEEVHGEFGVGLLASKLMLEGPLKKGKSSFMISGRRTYLDLLVKPFVPKEEKFGIFFYDINTKLNFVLNDKNKLFISSYSGKDALKFKIDNNKYGFQWGNQTSTLRWNHIYNRKLFSNTSIIYTNYKFNIFNKGNNQDGLNIDFSSKIKNYTIKHDIDFMLHPNYVFKTGIKSTYYRFIPSAFTYENASIDSVLNTKNVIKSFDVSMYAEAMIQPIPNLRFNIGVRPNIFHVNGKNYYNLEPRFAVGYTLPHQWAVKASFTAMNQHVHLLSNSGAGMPTDLWVPSTEKLKPKRAKQMALGIAKDLSERKWTLTMEGFYKKMDNILAYKDGTAFVLEFGDNPEAINEVDWQQNVLVGQGWSYGSEFLIQKKTGKFSGWLGYTLSWTKHQFDGINDGEKFYAKYDRRHDISIVGIYKPKPKVTLSASWVYATGNAITIPKYYLILEPHILGEGYSRQHKVVQYGKRNAFRTIPYHRLNMSIQFHKKKKKGRERTWEISVYNVYGHINPFIYIPNEDANTNKNKLSYFGLPFLPSFSYNLKF